MKQIIALFTSSVGRKYLMALTGAALVLFVIGHLVGNLQIFGDPDLINSYGAFLHSKPALLWVVRLSMLSIVGVHIWSAVTLALDNKAARPVPYAGGIKPVGASYASRTMIMSGLIVAAFIVYHLLHYTVQLSAINFTGKDFGEFKDELERHDVYKMMIVGFRQPIVSLFYIVAVGLLCLHLSHGISAMFQSLGIKNKYYGQVIDKVAKVIAVVIFLGYASIPIAVLMGLGKEVL